MITSETSLQELAALVSQALADAGISAVLSGGAAVSTYTDNEYESADLDFVCSAEAKHIATAIAPLGFERGSKGHARYFDHPEARWFVEFPPGPVSFGSTVADPEDIARIATEQGTILIITPTQCVMDRLAAYFHWSDQQSLDQAVMVARSRQIEWGLLKKWAAQEGIETKSLDYFEARVRKAQETS